MALVNSEDLEIGSKASDFKLPDTVSGESKSLKDLQGERGLAILFICNHCPYVHQIEDSLAALASDYIGKGVGFVAISSNDFLSYPEDSPEMMKKRAAEKSYPFPYLVDETQEVAKLYRAACTPDIYLYSNDLSLYYHGQFDSSRPGKGQSTGEDLKNAMDLLLSDSPPPKNQLPSVGCSIKWKR